MLEGKTEGDPDLATEYRGIWSQGNDNGPFDSGQDQGESTMYIVKINATTKTPHLFQDDRDLGEMKKANDKKSKTGYAYKLPENDLGRQWLKGNLAYDGYEIGAIAERKPAERKNWLNYLSDEDKEILEGLKAKALERMAKAKEKKVLTPEEKLEAKIAKLIAQRDALLKRK